MATAVIVKTNNGKIARAKAVDYGIAKISYSAPFISKVSHTMPFRVSFTNIQVPGYNVNSPAPIGIAIIGFNNYIL